MQAAQQAAPPAAGGGGMMGGLGRTMAEGAAFGVGSSMAHRAVRFDNLLLTYSCNYIKPFITEFTVYDPCNR